jgi:hypothetical protein
MGAQTAALPTRCRFRIRAGALPVCAIARMMLRVPSEMMVPGAVPAAGPRAQITACWS